MKDVLSRNEMILLGVVVFLLLFLTRVPGIFFHYVSWDEAAMMSEAWAMTKGQILYQDIYQIHPVFQFLLFTPFFLLLPTELAPHAIKCLNILFILAGAVVVRKILYFWLKDGRSSWLGSILFIFFLGHFHWTHSSFGEFYILFPVLCAAYLFFTRRAPALAGFLLGVAFFFKQVALFDAAALLIYLLVFDGTPFRSKIAFLARASAGALVSTFIAYLYPLIHGTVPVTIKSTIFTGLSYSSVSDFDFSETFYNLLMHIVLLLKMLVHEFRKSEFTFIFLGSLVLAFLSLLVPGGPKADLQRPNRNFFAWLCLWFAVDFAGLSIIGRPYPHYFIQLVPVIVFLFVYIVSLASPFMKKLITLCLIATCLFMGLLQFREEVKANGTVPDKVKKSKEIAQTIQQVTTPEETIFLFAEESLDVFYLSERLSPNGIYMFVDMDSFHTKDLQSEKEKRRLFLENPPQVIVEGDFWPYLPENSKVENFLGKIITEEYRLLKKIDGSRIYLRHD